MYNKVSQKKKFSILTNSVTSACIIAGSLIPASSLMISNVSATTADGNVNDTQCSTLPSNWMNTFLPNPLCSKIVIESDTDEYQSTDDSASSSDSSESTPIELDDYSDTSYNNLPKATPARSKTQEPSISYLKPCTISAYAFDVNNNKPTAHGTISCNETLVKVAPKFNIPYAGDATFEIESKPGYDLVAVIVDGKNIGPVSSYTFETVTGDHSIAAYFRSSEDYSICDLYED